MLKKSALILLLLSLSMATNAAWQLDNSNSWLSLLSIKKQDIAEVGKFKQLAGTIGDTGKAELKIDLASVDTNIIIRDQRLQEFLFQTAQFSHATLTAELEMEKINNLKVGEMNVQPLTVQLGLHGMTQDINSNVVVTRLANDQLLVVNQTLLFIKAANFKLLEGIEKLRQLAGLPRISTLVPVSFVFTFKKEQ